MPEKSKFPRFGKKLTVAIGEPLNIQKLLDQHRKTLENDDEIRSAISQDLWDALDKLRIEAESKHQMKF